MERKDKRARELFARGLTIGQISAQLHCSRTFLRRVQAEMSAERVDNEESSVVPRVS